MRLRFMTRISISVFVSAIAAAVLLATGVRAETPAPSVKALKVDKPQRLLFVGNSYLYYGDSLHNHVRRMVIAAGIYKKKKLKYKSATISGSAIFDHNIDSYIEPASCGSRSRSRSSSCRAAAAAPWRKGRDVKFRETVAEFSKKIKAAGGETALYMTHAYVKPHKRFDPDMIDAIAKLYVTTGNETGSLVIPVGLAFDEAYRRRPDMKLHKPFDGSHPSLIGTYLAAATVFASLYGQSPVGNPYDYFGKIGKDDLAFLQKVADDTVKKFYGR